MNITISSPDGLGDFILRLPLFRTLEEAGHSLQIWMLSPAYELAQFLLPAVRVERIATHPYTREARQKWRPFAEEFARIECFDAEQYVVSLFQPSFFDEMWIEHGGEIPVAGLVSRNKFWPSETLHPAHELALAYSIKVPVDNDLAEVAKNRVLAEALTGQPCRETCHIDVPTASLDRARALLGQHSLTEGGYWLVCVGTRPGLDAKDWGEANWIAALTAIEQSGGGRFVFIGNEGESPSLERIRGSLAEPQKHLNLAAQPPDMATALGLAALSAGYLGRDSGPMHLTAAVGRPVLALFAGGHWGRFFPEATRGIVLGARGACRACTLREGPHDPWCLKHLPVSEVLKAWQDFPAVTSLEVREWTEPGAALDADFVRQALECRRVRMRSDRPRNKLHEMARRLVSR